VLELCVASPTPGAPSTATPIPTATANIGGSTCTGACGDIG
jgi:hypothetical protein